VKGLETGLGCTVRVRKQRVCAIAHIAQQATFPYTRISHAYGSAQTGRGAARTLRVLTLSALPAVFAGLPIEITWRFIMTQFSRVSVLVAAVALTTLAGCASTRQQESTGQYIDDTAITASVKTAIFNEPTLKSAEINVETFKGRVQLSGFVSSRANIDRAVVVAQGIKGVTSVGNDMRLK
jgi:hypothetical protein